MRKKINVFLLTFFSKLTQVSHDDEYNSHFKFWSFKNYKYTEWLCKGKIIEFFDHCCGYQWVVLCQIIDLVWFDFKRPANDPLSSKGILFDVNFFMTLIDGFS